jgi:hypothetical protein
MVAEHRRGSYCRLKIEPFLNLAPKLFLGALFFFKEMPYKGSRTSRRLDIISYL